MLHVTERPRAIPRLDRLVIHKIRLKSLERQIVEYLQAHEGENVSMPVLAAKLENVPYTILHGQQHFLSRAIARLRKRGFLVDTPVRCEKCGRAARPHKSQNLLLTEAGRRW
jgi:threonyl-tRNA synthetase